MTFKNPDFRTLIICWLVLLALTIGTMLSGKVTSQEALSGALIISLGVITWVKAMVILRYYLNLKSASRGWNKAFNSYLFLVIGMISLIFLLA